MTRIANRTAREYRSQLRDQQAEETRVRILDATLRVMGGGVASVSIPEIAREAGVSVPTVYRHFGTKRDLLAAVYPYLSKRAGLRDLIVPETVPEFREMVHTMFSRLESLGEVARAAMTSPASDEPRRMQMPERKAMSQRFVAGVMPNATPTEQKRMARVLLVLASSSSMRMWREQIGSSVDEAADDIDWVLRTIVAATNEGKKNR
jgi:AcrR family transcriptional regulator